MAGSRLEKFGSIYSRVRGLMQAGAMKPHEKPIWFDVYEAFPPKREPSYASSNETTDDVRELYYPEDLIRAKFYKTFGNLEPINLLDEDSITQCERFIQKYNEVSRSGASGQLKLEATLRALRSEGMYLKTLKDIQKEREERRRNVKDLFANTAKKKTVSTEDVFGDLMISLEQQDYLRDENGKNESPE